MGISRLILFLYVLATCSALSVEVFTIPEGPSYKAGTLFTVICSIVNGTWPSWWYYQYDWSYGCSFTNIFTDYAINRLYLVENEATNPINCRNVYRCRATDLIYGTVTVGEATIETVTDIAIQILPSQANYLTTTRNISILTVNESGRFLDISCNSGFKKPNIGKWIHPNGTDINAMNAETEKFKVERGGGIVSLPHTTLKLREGYSVNQSDTGLYTCKMLDNELVERESHIWILSEQNFSAATPEYFTSYSGSTFKLECRYSDTPGEILWFDAASGFVIDNDGNAAISQRLLQSSPTILYEGVLEINSIDDIGIPYCTIHSTIIGNHADPFPTAENIFQTHYFFLSSIGMSESFTCTFIDPLVTKIEVYSDGEILKTETNDSSIMFTIDLVQDLTHNKEYSCIASVPDNETTYYTNLSIVALIPPHALLIHVDLPDTVQAGQSFSIALSAVKASGFTHDQTVSCTDRHEVPISTLNGFVYPDNPVFTGLTLHYDVAVIAPKLSLAGLYLCNAFLETPPQMDNVSDNANFSIRVTVPSPTVFLNNSDSYESETILMTGAIARFSCSATLNTSYVDVPVQSIFTWFKNGVPLNSSNRFQILDIVTEISDELNCTKYYSELQIAPLLKEDESVLVCSVIMTAADGYKYVAPSEQSDSSMNLIVKGPVELDSIPIEVNFILTISCHQWIGKPGILEAIAKIILEVLVQRCDCQYLINYVTDERLVCSYQQTYYGAYRARLYSTDEVEAIVLTEHLQHWINVTSESILVAEQSNITLNAHCKVELNSFNDSVCSASEANISMISMGDQHKSLTILSPIVVWSQDINQETPTSNSADDANFSSNVLIISAFGLLAFSFLMITCFVIIVILAHRKSKMKKLQQLDTNYGDTELRSAKPNAYINSTYDNFQGCNYQNRELPELPPDSPKEEYEKKSVTDSEIYMDMGYSEDKECEKHTYEDIKNYYIN